MENTKALWWKNVDFLGEILKKIMGLGHEGMSVYVLRWKEYSGLGTVGLITIG